jgi:sugar phosphate permease
MRATVAPYIYWFLGAFFYLYQYVLRVSPGVMTDDLMRDFNVTATTIGSLMGLSSFAYVFMQIPAGTMLDNYGVRKLLSISVIIAAIGALLFGVATDMMVLYVARVLLGGGSAFAFVGASKIISLYFPQKRLPFMVSLTMLVGSAGGVIGVGPLAYLLAGVGWRNTMMIIAGVGAFIAFLMFALIREKKGPQDMLEGDETIKDAPFFEGLKTALKTPQIMIVAVWGFCIYMPLCVFADSWGVPYLMAALSISKPIAAEAISMIYIGILFGCPIYGWLATKYENYRVIFIMMTSSLFLLFWSILWLPHAVEPYLKSILFLIGMIISGNLLMFPAATRHAPPSMTGSVVGVVNTLTMMSGAVSQKLVGIAVDYLWDGTWYEGVPQYSSSCYQKPLNIVLVMMLLGTVVGCFVRNKTKA